MIQSFRRLDEVLRGDATRSSRLEGGQVHIRAGGLSLVVVVLGAVYGVCMGSFAVIRTGGAHDAWMQMLASAIKVPLLFFLTLIVTLPSLYVFNALVGGRLTLRSTTRLLVAMLGVMMAVLTSLGPIVAFFGLSTTSYPFMKLLNVVMATIAGILGLAFLIRTLHRLVTVAEPLPEPSVEQSSESGGPLTSDGPTHHRARAVFKIWVVVFALVGAQMSWVLRPFIGNPDLPFAWLRARESNFYMDVFRSFGKLVGADVP